MIMPGPGEPLDSELRDVPDPGPGEAVVRVGGSSLNYHDLVNLMGLLDGPWPRVPMTDGAGLRWSRSATTSPDLREGDRVIGTFHPAWRDGRLTTANGHDTPGDTCDGWLQQYMTFPAAHARPHAAAPRRPRGRVAGVRGHHRVERARHRRRA